MSKTGCRAFGSTQYEYDPSGKRVAVKTPNDDGTTNYQFSFYGITGQRLATVGCTETSDFNISSCWVTGQNLYFKGKMLVSNGVGVVTDRLGSVRGNTQGERMSYYPYGEERTSTVDGRDKFGTYFRDGAMDYADQRYYLSGTGRFRTADPSAGSNGADPGSWNRYAYVGGDPINFADGSGLNRLLCDVYTDFGCAARDSSGRRRSSLAVLTQLQWRGHGVGAGTGPPGTRWFGCHRGTRRLGHDYGGHPDEGTAMCSEPGIGSAGFEQYCWGCWPSARECRSCSIDNQFG